MLLLCFFPLFLCNALSSAAPCAPRHARAAARLSNTPTPSCHLEQRQGISQTAGAKAPILLATLPAYAILFMLGREVRGGGRGLGASARGACLNVRPHTRRAAPAL